MAALSPARGIGLGPVVRAGGCGGPGAADSLEHMAGDRKTGAIAMYLEEPADVARLMKVMGRATRRKPVFVWKSGRPAAPARVWHRGQAAPAAPASIWSAALRQAGAVEVTGLEELADTLLLYQAVGPLERANLGIICGLTDGGGGEAVLSADACAAQGIDVVPFTDRTRRSLLGLLGQVGSVLVNPVDVSQRPGNLEVFDKTFGLVASEPGVDLIVVYENVDLLVAFVGQPTCHLLNDVVAGAGRKHGKPVIVVSPPGAMDRERLEVEARLTAAGTAVFPSMERAAKAIASVRQDRRLHPARKARAGPGGRPGIQENVEAPAR